MVYPWMFEDYVALRPLAELAELLACDKNDWPALYDLERLAHNTVPCAAAIYDEDMYVERKSLSSDREHGNMRTWVTNEFEHNGLRADGPRIFEYLLDLFEACAEREALGGWGHRGAVALTRQEESKRIPMRA